jgi:antitoxin (DNA-binding transcriptional repressor) of toxin-antitoxin stability system
MIRVNIHDAKTHLSRYIEKVEQGEVVVVCRHNKPVAEIRVLAKPASVVRKEGLLKGRVSWSPGAFAPMTEEELVEFDGPAVFPR